MRPIQSDSLNELAPALLAAVAELQDVPTDKVADLEKYKFNYASLETILIATRPVLARHGLAVIQSMVPFDEPGVAVAGLTRDAAVTYPLQVLGALRTVLIHRSGQFIAGEHPIGGEWGDQSMICGEGNKARRFGLKAICGITESNEEFVNKRTPQARPRQFNGAPAPARTAPPRREGPDLEDMGQPDSGPDPGSSAYYRQNPEDVAREMERHNINQAFAGNRSAPAPAPAARPPADDRQHSWPPATGRGLYAATRENKNRFDWFDGYGKGNAFPAKFVAWSDREVAEACAAYADAVKSANGVRH